MKFFKGQLELEAQIEVNNVFRIGDRHNRSVMIKLKHPSDKALIFANTPKLSGKVNERNKSYFIQDDKSDQQAEQQRTYRELIKENKEVNPDKQLKIKMTRGKIMVNNETVKETVVTPTFADILRTPEEDLKQIHVIKLSNWSRTL